MRPAPPPPGSPRHRSLAELAGLDVQRGAYGTGRSAWLARALSSPLWHLGPAELRLLLEHDYRHALVLTLVVERLESDPLAAVDGDVGALAAAAIRVPPEAWQQAGIAPERLADVAEQAASALQRWAAAPRWLLEDLVLAQSLFRGLPEHETREDAGE